MLQHMLSLVERFQRDIIGIEIPTSPTLLPEWRVKARADHFREEDAEFEEAKTLEEQADALLDGIYLRLGALVEMGILPGPVFEEVHDANMLKKRGAVAKRPGSRGYDAVKPEGWTPPDLTPYLTIKKSDALLLLEVKRDEEKVHHG